MKLRNGYIMPVLLMLLGALMGFGLLYMRNDYNINIIYTGLIIECLFIVVCSIVVFTRMGDKFLVLFSFMLISIGMLMICRLDIERGLKQIVWVGIGFVAFFGAYLVYYFIDIWEDYWYLYVGLSVILFVLTLTIGRTVNGSKNWIGIGSFAFQPSEIIKILYIMFLSCHYSGAWTKPIKEKITPSIMTAIVTYLFIGFLVLQRDWGTILVLFSIYIFMIYVYEKNPLFLAVNVGAALVVAFLGYKFMHHIQLRVTAWLNPWEHIEDIGYQVTQSLFAISAGGYFGKGLGNGTPYHIPEVHTDFIFSAICEEMGVFVGAAVVLLFFLLAYRCFKIALKATNPYNKSVGLGVTLMFSLQCFIIIGGVIKFIPLTGITLPFVSYGGSSMVVSFISLGIMQAISAREERGERSE
ncbi:MAG: FtsW/RodA/SpoVE family cell cycle protein [Clostridia bacterium]|nr:FtsW/RodA/SpoVE family cell cycle protein [Clostridia bacterium]